VSGGAISGSDALEPADRIRWSVAVAAVAIAGVAVLPRFMTGALAVQITEDLGFDLAELGALFGIYFGVSALGSAPLGRVAEWRGWSEVLRAAALGSAITLLAIALIAREAWVIGLLFVLGGLTATASKSSANLALARSVPPRNYGFLFGVQHVAVPGATMLGGLAVPAFGLTVGWRWAFVTAAVLAVAAAVAVPSERRASQGPARPSARPARVRTPMRTLALLALAAALGIGAVDSLASFVVVYAVDVGFAEGTAGLLLALGSSAGIVTRLIAGWLIDRRQHAGLLGIAALLAAGALGLVVVATGGRSWVVAGSLVGFIGGWGWSGLLTFAVVSANPEAPATATGIAHTGTYVGAAAGPVLFGLLAEHVSYEAAWWSTAGALAAATAIMVWVWITDRDAGMAVASGTRA
jgi:predicted MFS family arabinose efflux permease